MRNTKIRIFTVVLTVFSLISCSDDDVAREALTCNSLEPFEEFSWLEDLRNSIDNCSCERSILKGEYRGNTVYYEIMTDELCNWQFETDLYNCNGQIIKEYRYSISNPNPYEEYQEEVTEREVLYVCQNDRE